MVTCNKQILAGYVYHKSIWFSTQFITNIVALSDLIQQYPCCHATNNNHKLMFGVHRELENLPNIEYRMHESGLHHCDPREQAHITFVSPVSGNKEGFTKRQIKSANTTRTLYGMLHYTSMYDFKWVIHSK